MTQIVKWYVFERQGHVFVDAHYSGRYLIMICITVPEMRGTVRLSFIRRGRSSARVATNAPVIPTIGSNQKSAITTQMIKHAALPSKLLLPISFVCPHLLPTNAAAVSPKIIKNIQTIAIDFSKKKMHSKILTI